MKAQFPWIGRSHGSAGGMTTTKVNDKNVMRAKAFEVTNPNTPAQQMQRDFFKQVQEVCASVTEDQLRSLFGVKPKTMTRRNALSKQIASAYTINDGIKSVDFSKLLAIGNGLKVNTHLQTNITTEDLIAEDFNALQMNLTQIETPTLILVVFDLTDSKIIIINTGVVYDESIAMTLGDFNLPDDHLYNCYLTIETNGDDVSEKPFGSFTIKTRATE